MDYIKENALEFVEAASDQVIEEAAENTPEFLANLASSSIEECGGLPARAAMKVAKFAFKQARQKTVNVQVREA